MKASVSPALAIFALLAVPCMAVVAIAQDAVVQKDGQRRAGQITSVKDGIIRMKVGPVETGVPMANIASVTMAPPKSYDETLAAWQTGDAKKTLSILTPLVATFNGLPTGWAERASSLYGEALLAAGQIDKAEAAFADFQKFYPAAANSADVGLAQLAIEKKDFSTAREKLIPIAEKAKSTKLAESGDSAVFGQALYLLGVVQEASAENSEAMENYLLVTTLFHEDKAVSQKASDHAKALAAKNVIVP